MSTGRQKPADQLKGNPHSAGATRGALTILAPRDPDSIIIPPTPVRLNGDAVEPGAAFAWDRWWSSDLSQIVDLQSDMLAMERWILAVDEWLRLKLIIDEQPTTEGSTGQLRVNPLATRLKEVEAVISKYEDQFGMTPMSRMRLGIKLGEAAASLSALLDDLDDDDAADDDGIEQYVVDA
jgi:P27 family predicted phage terminase small subunit